MIAVLAALVGGALGYALALGAALVLLGLIGVSQAEGKRAVLAGLVIAPLGALTGAGLALWLALRGSGAPGAGSVFVTLGLLGLGGAAALLGLRSRRPLGQNRAAPRLLLEIRSPVAPALLAARLVTDRNTMPVSLAEGRAEGGLWVVPGVVELYYRTKRRQIEVDGDGAGWRLALPLRAAPAPSEWSDWQAADPAAPGGAALRWRVAEA